MAGLSTGNGIRPIEKKRFSHESSARWDSVVAASVTAVMHAPWLAKRHHAGHYDLVNLQLASVWKNWKPHPEEFHAESNFQTCQ
jgi:hypothetical protein